MFERALAVDGYTKESELAMLAHIAAEMPPEAVVVEVGAWKGRSTLAIASGLELVRDARLIAVDTFSGDPGWAEQPDPTEARQTFEGNTSSVAFLEIVQAPSAEAAALVPDRSIDWVFIDALHDYKSVRSDIAAWAPKLRRGALMSGHDYGRAGVTEAVSVSFGRVAIEGSVWMTRKHPRARPIRVAHRYAFSIRRKLRSSVMGSTSRK